MQYSSQAEEEDRRIQLVKTFSARRPSMYQSQIEEETKNKRRRPCWSMLVRSRAGPSPVTRQTIAYSVRFHTSVRWGDHVLAWGGGRRRAGPGHNMGGHPGRSARGPRRGGIQNFATLKRWTQRMVRRPHLGSSVSAALLLTIFIPFLPARKLFTKSATMNKTIPSICCGVHSFGKKAKLRKSVVAFRVVDTMLMARALNRRVMAPAKLLPKNPVLAKAASATALPRGLQVGWDPASISAMVPGVSRKERPWAMSPERMVTVPMETRAMV
mmetsp:Transcript_17293/g.34407  ORF Transcript_17293/g.34407 Transcript_17293/m.34407 type:complete len:270 (-) Transcript_17293:67-876(-)